jgi:hypothetical protein
MRHPLETAADTVFARLRAFDGAGPVAPGRHIVPGCWLAADTRQGEVTAALEPAPDALMRLDIRVVRPGRWLSLNFALDRTPLAAGDVLGLAADLAAEAELPLGVTIRSGQDGTEQDTSFPDRLVAAPDRRLGVALMTVAPSMALTRPPQWRNLMLRLPMRDMRLTIGDLRLFLVPTAGQKPPAAPEAAGPAPAAPPAPAADR